MQAVQASQQSCVNLQPPVNPLPSIGMHTDAIAEQLPLQSAAEPPKNSQVAWRYLSSIFFLVFTGAVVLARMIVASARWVMGQSVALYKSIQQDSIAAADNPAAPASNVELVAPVASGDELRDVLLSGLAELIGDMPESPSSTGGAFTTVLTGVADWNKDTDMHTWSGLQWCFQDNSKLEAIAVSSSHDQFTGTGISGRLPTAWNRILSLRFLSVKSTSISGALPESWSTLTALQGLTVKWSYLSGDLPAVWGNLTALTMLELSCNMLSGPIPQQWSALTRLKWLGVSQNAISGHLPSQLGGISELATIYLNQNHLEGPLPAQWSKLQSLTILEIGRNSLTGHLHAGWGALTRLQGLDMSSNQLSGPLPPGWNSLQSLTSLVLCGNKLTGQLPPEWGCLRRLRRLDFNGNQLTGIVPASWSGMCSLTYLGLIGSSVHGPRPQWEQTVEVAGLHAVT